MTLELDVFILRLQAFDDQLLAVVLIANLFNEFLIKNLVLFSGDQIQNIFKFCQPREVFHEGPGQNLVLNLFVQGDDVFFA